MTGWMHWLNLGIVIVVLAASATVVLRQLLGRRGPICTATGRRGCKCGGDEDSAPPPNSYRATPLVKLDGPATRSGRNGSRAP